MIEWNRRTRAALVDEQNRAYHERWHIAGAVCKRKSAHDR